MTRAREAKAGAPAALALLLALGACPGEAPVPRGDVPLYPDTTPAPRFDGQLPPPPDTRITDINVQPDLTRDSGPPPPDTGGGGGCAANEQGFGGKCYRVVFTTNMTYSAAKSACAQNGASVVAIETQSEDAFVYSMLPAITTAAWIGLVRQGGSFVWESSGAGPGYTNWASGEPNNDAGNEDCTVLWGPALTFANLRAKWNDAPCDSTPRDTVICER